MLGKVRREMPGEVRRTVAALERCQHIVDNAVVLIARCTDGDETDRVPRVHHLSEFASP